MHCYNVHVCVFICLGPFPYKVYSGVDFQETFFFIDVVDTPILAADLGAVGSNIQSVRRIGS